MSQPIRCPDCHTGMSEHARFCPGCKRPRSHVELELRRAADLTGIPYAELLERAQDEDSAGTATYSTAETQASYSSDGYAQASSERPNWQKAVAAIAIFVGILWVLGSVFGEPSSAASSSRSTGSSSSSALSSRPTATPAQSSNTYRVEYRITMTGSNEMSLTYNNAQGGTEQVKTYATNGGWSKAYNMRRGDFAYISVQNQKASGSVKCEIYVNGQQWKVSSSSGGYTIATCSGSVGR